MAVDTETLLLAQPDALAPLLARARSGDAGAREQLVRAGFDLVFPLCRRIVGNDADAGRAAEEALVTMVRGLDRFDERGRYAVWLYRLAVDAALTEMRRGTRRPLPPSNDIALILSESDLDSMVESIDVDFALMQLPVDLRIGVVLRDLCDLGYEDMAEILGVSATVACSRVARARSRLAELLGPDRFDR